MLAGVWYSLAAATALAAEPWETVDDFQLVPGLPATGAALGICPGGNVYSAGSGVTSPDGSTRTAVVRMTADAGQTWTSLPEFGDPNWIWAHYRGFATDASGRLYVSGNGWLADRPGMDLGWIVRESVDGIHVAGWAEDEAGRLYWVVRQGTPQIYWNEQAGAWASSLTWTLSDTFQLAPGQPARANDIAADARGNVFVNGRGADANGVDHWLVRKSSGAGSRLSVRRVPDGLQLAWSADARDFRLESASTLADGGDWREVDLPPTSGQSVVAVEATNPAACFRLRQR